MARREQDPITIDFETEKIERRPAYPPKPVGVSILRPGDKKATYHAWGHDSANNTTKEKAARELRDIFKGKDPLLFHNGNFDTDVAVSHMGCVMPSWDRIHDTMYLLFLQDPHAFDLKLKPSAERLLGMRPEEKDAVADWLIDNGLLRKQSKGRAGEFMARAPGDLVGRYANGDTLRTLKLYRLLAPQVRDAGMWQAYQREMELMPILLRNEQEGIRVDVRLLETEEKLYASEIIRVDAWLRKRLKSKDLNIDSDQDLADALENAGVVLEWNYTEKGNRSVSKKNLTPDMFEDPRVYHALGYRNRASTCLNTFMRPWLEMAHATGDRIHTHWNQTRGADGGARTGRLSSSPNFQNIPKDFEDKGDGFVHPKFITGLAQLPLMRKYILPDKGHVFLHRDYNQQELRILAHFEDHTLLERYIADPRLDVHDYVREEIASIFGIHLPRSATKTINFGLLYGMGLGELAKRLNTDVTEARKLRNAQQTALPGVKELDKGLKDRGKSGGAVRTWGGRLYYSEEPKVIKGRYQTFEYKLLNYIIQGSAADCSKQSIINYDKLRKDSRLLVSVHDENNLSAPKGAAKREMAALREAMESVQFDVPMLSDGKIGDRWGSLKAYKD